jgi:hypothetical protein
MNEVDVIRGAREYLSDPKHWHQGGAGDDGHGALCVAVALGRQCPNDDDWAILTAVHDGLRAHIPARIAPQPWGTDRLLHLRIFGSVFEYNDDPGTTHQDILDLLDKTLADFGGLA